MNESENYLDQLLNAVDGRSDLNDSDPVNPEEIESKEQMPQKSTRETIDIPDSNDLFMDQFEQELRKDNDPDEFLKLQTEDFVKANRLLLRKIIQSVTVYEENFVISFKSGIELEV